MSQRPVQGDWNRERPERDDGTLDQLRADLERSGLAGVRASAAPEDVAPPIAVAVLQLLDGTLIGILSCSTEAGPATIGRGREAMIRVHDPYVSRLHATLIWDEEGGTHLLTELSAQNGTYLNGRRVTAPVRVLDGARIRMGTTEILYIRRSD